MGKDDLIDEIERRIEGSETLSAEDLDVEQRCRYCETPMPYEGYNEHTPSSDYVIHIMPTERDRTPPDKRIYCSPRCLIKHTCEMEEQFLNK
jgi:hypothetical protein